MNGLTPQELLRMYDRTEAYPMVRAAIRAVLRPSDGEEVVLVTFDSLKEAMGTRPMPDGHEGFYWPSADDVWAALSRPQQR